ncbi:hypothetical protein [Acetobacterium tundrae]|uniref:hypothetical protein n=1 Tax=Acetobacterium tundrae TaxID=132932 RepID=UPI0011E017C3|nr:hypothetical protein [Acetobacterium tundrae]
MAIIENQKVYYNTELEKLFKNHKIKGFFFKKFGWFKKKFEIEASAEYFEYDRIFEKFSVFFKDEKYNIFHLKKIIFLIERKIDKDNEYKPQISEFLNNSRTMIACFLTIMGIFVSLYPEKLLKFKTFPNLDPAVTKYVTVCISLGLAFLFFLKEIDGLLEQLSLRKKSVLLWKKKYLLILNCLFDEISRREKLEEIRKLIVKQ